jgi:cytochrome c biogenesis protein CcmG, thiol:disulfide interchange protein DsbE
MTPTRLALGAFGSAVAILLAIGLVQLARGPAATANLSTLTAAQIRAGLIGSPPRLAALHAQADQLLGGGDQALHALLATLRGEPVVINKWVSWCAPCRAEFAAFQHASVNLGRRVAFIGIDSTESSRTDGEVFLDSHPVGYPSYYDHSGALGEQITDSSFMPVTVFYNRAGQRYIHQGPYPSLEKLEADIERYALPS